MVHDFFPELEKRDLGWRAGYLGAAFNLGQLFGAIIWVLYIHIYAKYIDIN
jgi:hypothetical protein